MNHEVNMALGALPPATVAGIHLAGIALADWVLLATLVYTLLLIGGWVYDRYKRK